MGRRPVVPKGSPIPADAEALARAMGEVLPGYMMPSPYFREADFPHPDPDTTWGGRRGDGTPRMASDGVRTVGQAMEDYYLKERAEARDLYRRLAVTILDVQRESHPVVAVCGECGEPVAPDDEGWVHHTGSNGTSPDGAA